MGQIPPPSLRAEGEAIHAAGRGGGMDCFVAPGVFDPGVAPRMTVGGCCLNSFRCFGAVALERAEIPSSGPFSWLPLEGKGHRSPPSAR